MKTQIVSGITVEAKFWTSPDGLQKRVYLKAEGRGHNTATYNVKSAKFEFSKNAYNAMSLEFANQCKAAFGF